MSASGVQRTNGSAKRLGKDKLLALVTKYLDRHQPTDYRLSIVPGQVRKDEFFWYVVVQPSRNDVRSYDYISRMVEAELELQEEHNVNVVLVPLLPE